MPIVWGAEWVPGPVWTGAANMAATAIVYPDRPADDDDDDKCLT